MMLRNLKIRLQETLTTILTIDLRVAAHHKECPKEKRLILNQKIMQSTPKSNSLQRKKMRATLNKKMRCSKKEFREASILENQLSKLHLLINLGLYILVPGKKGITNLARTSLMVSILDLGRRRPAMEKEK